LAAHLLDRRFDPSPTHLAGGSAERNAVEDFGNVAFADGNLFFNRSGMTVSQTAEIIAEILHGVSFGGTTGQVSWRRIESPVEQMRGQ